ncbi:hypothetical protein D3C87_601500 [compost metagenome]
MKLLISILFAICLVSCNKEKVDVENFDKFKINQNVIPDSISRKLVQKNNSVVSVQSLAISPYKYPAYNENYICNASIIENDTLNIWINNYNGYFGNGIFAQVIGDEFRIKSITPKVIKGTKFENYELKAQELILNKATFRKGDSLFGYINFECVVDSSKSKKMFGYFKTKIN